MRKGYVKYQKKRCPFLLDNSPSYLAHAKSNFFESSSQGNEKTG